MSRDLFDALPEIAGQVAGAPGLLLCASFDGTLTPLTDHPAQAVLTPEFRRALTILAGNDAVCVAVVSVRERGDLQKRIDIPGLVLAGNHGLEISGPGLLFVEPTAARQAEAMKELATDLTARLQALPGVMVENKGLTVSVHCRQAEAAIAEEARRTIHATLATKDHPFQLSAGDRSFEIRPRVDWNKGSAVTWIREHAARPGALVIYLGDDVSDEDAFAALRDSITVQVGGRAETAAQYSVKGPDEVLTFLEWLIQRVNGRSRLGA